MNLRPPKIKEHRITFLCADENDGIELRCIVVRYEYMDGTIFERHHEQSIMLFCHDKLDCTIHVGFNDLESAMDLRGIARIEWHGTWFKTLRDSNGLRRLPNVDHLPTTKIAQYEFDPPALLDGNDLVLTTRLFPPAEPDGSIIRLDNDF